MYWRPQFPLPCALRPAISRFVSSAAGDLRAAPDVPDPTRIANEDAITEILADWRQRLRTSPDLQPREGVRGQRERSLTRALLTAAEAREGSPQATDCLGKLAMIAALYGADQPRDRLDPGALCEELAHLRHAVWHYLRSQRLSTEIAARHILAFDRVLSLATRAALTSGYQCADESSYQGLEARG